MCDLAADNSKAWVECADEYDTCECTGYVRYGNVGPPSAWSCAVAVVGALDCTNDAMGGDPLPNKYKACQCLTVAVAVAPPVPMIVAKPAIVSLEVAGVAPSNDAHLAVSVPAVGAASVDLCAVSTAADVLWETCAAEYGACECKGYVKYGKDGGWSCAVESTVAVDCTNDAMGGDPFPNVDKECMCASSGAAVEAAVHSAGTRGVDASTDSSAPFAHSGVLGAILATAAGLAVAAGVAVATANRRRMAWRWRACTGNSGVSVPAHPVVVPHALLVDALQEFEDEAVAGAGHALDWDPGF